MANKNDYQVFRDGTLPPCVWELAFSFRKDPPLEAAAKLSAFLTAHGATEKEISEAFRVLDGRGLLSMQEESVSPDRSLLALCKSASDCREVCALLLGDGGDASYCSICPVCARLGGIYTNANYEDETALLTLLYSCASVGDVREIITLGKTGQLVTLFSSNQYVTTFERRHVFPVPYLLAFALYIIVDNRIHVSIESTDALIDSVVSILSSREIPAVGSVDVARLFADEGVRNYVDAVCKTVRYREVDYSAAFRAMDLCGCTVFNERRATMLGEEGTNKLDKFFSFEEFDVVSGPKSDDAGGDPDGAMEVPEPFDAVQQEKPAEAVENDRKSSADAETTDANEETVSEQAVVIRPISDENAEPAAKETLVDVKTAVRSIDKPCYDNGTFILPLSSTGDPVKGCIVGKDGLINPYVELGDGVKKPSEVYGLTPFTLAVSLESTRFYTVEYAICNNEEGFLLYIYQRRCVIFVGRSDWDYYAVVLASFRRNLPKKLTMLATPLIDYLTRMGEPLHRGIIPVYDAYRKAENVPADKTVHIKDILLPETDSLAAALRQYAMIWKETGLAAKDVEEDVFISAVYSSSVYSYEITGTRYPHLYHDGIAYGLGWSHSRLRANYVKMTFHLDREKTSSAERSKCYRRMLVRLGNGNAYLLRGLHLASCDPVEGFSVVVPLAAYPWAHNSLFLRLGEIAFELLGKHVGVTETIKCTMDKQTKEALTKAPETEKKPQKEASEEESSMKTDETPDENEAEDGEDELPPPDKKPQHAAPEKKSSPVKAKRKDSFDDFDNL